MNYLQRLANAIEEQSATGDVAAALKLVAKAAREADLAADAVGSPGHVAAWLALKLGVRIDPGRRRQYQTRRRWVLAAAVRTITKAGYQDVGNVCGLFHHTSVMNAVLRVNANDELRREADAAVVMYQRRWLTDESEG